MQPLSKAIYFVAGVDGDTLSKCPSTDRLWAQHLGFSLILSFLVVSAITYNATGYIVSDPGVRAAVSIVVALTTFMFDRALYQADWYLQPALNRPEWSVPRLARILLRLGISLCLSFALALFLELAIFSDTITGRLQEDFRSANGPLFEKEQIYETYLDSQITERRNALSAAEHSLEGVAGEESKMAGQVAKLQSQLTQIGDQILQYQEDKSAEQFGRKLRASQTGVAGRGRAYQFAQAQIENLTRHQQQLQNQIEEIRTARDSARANAQAQVRSLREEITSLLNSKAATAESFRKTAVEGSLEFQKQRNDPLARMEAYAELKRDPERGPAIVAFSWLVLLFVSFLEVVPVMAKMFFCPPSVYGALIKAETENERRRVERGGAAESSFGATMLDDSEANSSEHERQGSLAGLSVAKRHRPEISGRRRDLERDAVASVVAYGKLSTQD